MKKVFIVIIALIIVSVMLLACAGNEISELISGGESAPIDAEIPDEEPAPTPTLTPEPDMTVIESKVEELSAFILRAEKVYRDIVLGDLFSGHWDEVMDEWVWSEYLEEAPDLWIETPDGPYRGWNMPRWRVLPSSGFTSIAELNAAVHEYWSEDFGASTDTIMTESIDYAQIDGALYFFPAMASGIGDSFLGIIWELAQFDVLYQTADNHVTMRADIYLISYGNLYHGILHWEIADGRIAERDIEWGEFVLWRDMPEAIDAMVASRRWTEEQVSYNWESGWFEQQAAW